MSFSLALLPFPLPAELQKSVVGHFVPPGLSNQCSASIATIVNPRNKTAIVAIPTSILLYSTNLHGLAQQFRHSRNPSGGEGSTAAPLNCHPHRARTPSRVTWYRLCGLTT